MTEKATKNTENNNTNKDGGSENYIPLLAQIGNIEEDFVEEVHLVKDTVEATKREKTVVTETAPNEQYYDNLKDIQKKKKKRQSVVELESGFSSVVEKGKKVNKDEMVEITEYSPKSFVRGGHLNVTSGRFFTSFSGLYMFTATFHIKSNHSGIDVNKPNRKRNSAVRSRRSPPVEMLQARLNICIENRCSQDTSVESVLVLPSTGVTSSMTASGIMQVTAGQFVSVHLSTTWQMFILAGSSFSGLLLGI